MAEKKEERQLTLDEVQNLSEDEADQLLRQLSKPGAPDELFPVEEPPVEEAPSEEPPAEEPEAKVEPVEEEKPKDEPPAEEPEFDVQQSYAQELELLAKRAENAEKRLNTLAGTHGSKVDQLQRTIDALRQQMLQRPADTGEEYDQGSAPPQPRQAPPPPVTPQQGGEQAALRQLLIEKAYTDFMGDVSRDFDGKLPPDFAEKITPRVQQQINNFNDVVANVSPERIPAITRMVLDGAYTDYQLERLRAARADALQRKAEQVPRHKQVQAAAISGAGSTRGPAAKPKAVEDWTVEEADAELIRQFGDGHRRSRRR